MVNLPLTVDQGGDPLNRLLSFGSRRSLPGSKFNFDRQETRLLAQHTHRCIECFRLGGLGELSDLHLCHVTRHVRKPEVEQITPAILDEGLAGEEILGFDG